MVRALLAVLLSAALYAAAFPLPGFWPLVFVSLVPLLLTLESKNTARERFLTGLCFGAVFSMLMGYWLVPTLMNHFEKPLPLSVLFVLVSTVIPVALLHGLFGLFYHILLQGERRPVFYALIVPALWVFTEYLKEIVPVMLPWAGIACAAVPFRPFIQIADIGGTYGLTFVLVLINTLIAQIAGNFGVRGFLDASPAGRIAVIKKEALKNSGILLALAACLFLPAAYGLAREGLIEADLAVKTRGRDSVRAVLVQGNISDRERWSGLDTYRNIETHLKMTADGEGPGRTLAVWSETVLNSTGREGAELLSYISSRIGKDTVAVVGGVRRPPGLSGVHNTAFIVSGEKDFAYYDKNILLPYAETAGGNFLGRYYTAPAEFLSGQTPPGVKAGWSSLGLSICFEILYPWHVRDAVRDGAGILVNISNDSWFGRSAEPYYQLAAARLRAVENRRYLVRCSNSGISAVISPTGKILVQTGLFVRESKSAAVAHLDYSGPYAVLGDWPLYASLALILGFLLYRAFRDEPTCENP